MPKLFCLAVIFGVLAGSAFGQQRDDSQAADHAQQSGSTAQQSGSPTAPPTDQPSKLGDATPRSGDQAGSAAQDTQQPTQIEPPHSADRDREAGVSSSRETRIDISPPRDDAKNHPESTVSPDSPDSEADNSGTDVQEFHPWDPHKALKDIEVGDFYFKRKNYRAALDRYKEALVYKDNDAMANFRMAQCLEKLDQPDQARVHYENYLKILPHGALAEEAHKALDKLSANSGKGQ